MKLIAKLALGVFACALLISGLAVLSPKSAYAHAAPVVTDQDNPARHPFAMSCALTPVNPNDPVSDCNSPAIPAGQEVVIETISISGFSDTINTVLVASVNTSAGGSIQAYTLNPLADSGVGQPGFSFYTGVFSIRLYADPTTAIGCHFQTKNQNLTQSLTGSCMFSGYFVTLP